MLRVATSSEMETTGYGLLIAFTFEITGQLSLAIQLLMNGAKCQIYPEHPVRKISNGFFFSVNGYKGSIQ